MPRTRSDIASACSEMVAPQTQSRSKVVGQYEVADAGSVLGECSRDDPEDHSGGGSC